MEELSHGDGALGYIRDASLEHVERGGDAMPPPLSQMNRRKAGNRRATSPGNRESCIRVRTRVAEKRIE